MENTSEKLTNGGENSSNSFIEAMSDAPAFDPEAAKRRFERDHPSAIRDVEKARAMAQAGNKARMVEAKYEKLSTESIHKREDSKTFMEKVGIWMKAGKTADFREELAGKQYEIMQNAPATEEQSETPEIKEASSSEESYEELKKAS